MKPYVIIHNSVTLDGSLTGFMPDMELHYRLAGSYEADAHLIGSGTVVAGQEMFGGDVPPEEEDDFKIPCRSEKLPYWIVVDSTGRLAGLLHTCRRFEFCRDVIVLVSESTTDVYIKHLEQRNYRYIRTGRVKADILSALKILASEYGIGKVLTDSGQILCNLLINNNLADEISLLIHPLIKGRDSYNIFGQVNSNLKVTLIYEESFDNGCVWVRYKIG